MTGPVHTLFELLLAEDEVPLRNSLKRGLDACSGADLVRAIALLEPHKVLPLLAFRLSQRGELERVPSGARERLLAVHEQVRGLNTLLFLSAARLLKAAEQRQTTPLVLKGLLFADAYYPDFSTRPMGDLDLVSAPGESARLHAALADAGFSRQLDHVLQDHALAFENGAGVACDAHAYLEMYPSADWQAITRETSLRRLRGVRVRMLEPNVMLAHLMEHMHGHTRDLGLVLLWLLDVAFLLRRHAAQLEASTLRRFILEPGAWVLCLRVLALLERHGERLPEGLLELRPALRRVPVLSLASVLRARRTTPWGLPAPLGFLRLAAHHLSLRDYRHRAPPELTDLCLLPFDLIRTRLATHRARFRG